MHICPNDFIFETFPWKLWKTFIKFAKTQQSMKVIQVHKSYSLRNMIKFASSKQADFCRYCPALMAIQVYSVYLIHSCICTKDALGFYWKILPWRQRSFSTTWIWGLSIILFFTLLVHWSFIHVCFIQVTLFNWYLLCDPRRCEITWKVRAPRRVSASGAPNIVTWTK